MPVPRELTLNFIRCPVLFGFVSHPLHPLLLPRMFLLGHRWEEGPAAYQLWGVSYSATQSGQEKRNVPSCGWGRLFNFWQSSDGMSFLRQVGIGTWWGECFCRHIPTLTPWGVLSIRGQATQTKAISGWGQCLQAGAKVWAVAGVCTALVSASHSVSSQC